MVSNTVLHWLYSVLKPSYDNSDLCYQDVVLILQTFPDLKLKTDIFTYENGTQQLLLQVYTNPIPSNRSLVDLKDNFQLITHFPLDYPSSAPIVYINPLNGYLLCENESITNGGQLITNTLLHWSELYGSDISNESIDPKDNRLLKLFLELYQLLRASEFVRQPPPIPQKPNMKSPNYSNSNTTAEKGILSPPKLPLNPIRRNLIDQIQSELNANLYIKLKDLSNSVIANQDQIEDFESSLNNDINEIKLKTSEIETKAYDLDNERNRIIDSINSIDVKLSKPVSELIESSNVKERELMELKSNIKSQNDLIKLLESLFLNKRIVLGDYINLIRSIGYKQANLLNEVN